MRVLGFETPSATSHECRPLWGGYGVLGKAASKTSTKAILEEG